nr:hypothetical protein [Ardenticatena sp.]
MRGQRWCSPLDLVAWGWVLLWGAWQGMHIQAYAFDFDEGVHLMQARLIAEGAHPYQDIGMLLPPVWFEITAIFFRLLGAQVVVGRLLVVAMACAGALAMWALMRRFGAGAGIGAVLAFTCLPQGLWLSRAVMLEVPALVFVVVAFVLASHAGDHMPRWFASGMAFGLSLMTKAVAPAALVGLGWLAWHAPRRVRAMLALVAGTLFLVGATFAVYDARAMWHFTVAVRGAMREAFPWEPVHNMRRIVADGLLPIGGLAGFAIAGVWHNRQERLVQALGLWGMATLVLLFWHTPLRGQHLFSLGVIAAPLAPLGWRWVSYRTRRKWLGAGAALLVLLGQIALTWPSIAPTYAPDYKFDTGKAHLEAYIAATTAPTDTVVIDYPMIAFRAGRSSVPALAEISDGRIASGYLTSERAIAATEEAAPALIAFWSGRLKKLEAYTAWVEAHYVFDRFFGRSHPVYRRAPD